MDPNNIIASGDAPIVSSGDEIAFSSSPTTKKPKKLFIIILIIFVLIVAGLMGYLLLSDKSVKTPSDGNLESYRNYLLYGKTTADEDLSEPYLYSALDAKDVDYFSTLKKSYDGFRANLPNDLDSETKTLLNDYSNKLNLVVIYGQQPSVSQLSVLEKYAKDGEASTREMLENYADSFKNLSGLYDLNYYENLKTWSEKTLELAKEYASSGCLKGDVDYSCISRTNTKERDELLSVGSTAMGTLRAILNNAKADLVSQIELIKNNLFVGEENE